MIRLSHTTDMILVKAIMTDNVIWDESTEDNMNKDLFSPGYDGLSGWLLCEINGNIAGLILVHHDNNTTIKIHPYLFNEYRKYGRKMMIEFFKWFLKLDKTIKKVIVSIPFNRRIVYNFAKKVGFKDEGINRKSYFKNGETHDQWLLGLTKKEIKRLVCQQS
jgi:RimJ/RimL family protein N-acetyltransferase